MAFTPKHQTAPSMTGREPGRYTTSQSASRNMPPDSAGPTARAALNSMALSDTALIRSSRGIRSGT